MTDEQSAYRTIERFWDIQNDGDYNRLVPLFAEDAVVEDPVYGRFEGRDAIAGFMARMVDEMGERSIRFRLLDLAGDGEVAWAQWVAETPRGEIQGCGLYRVRDGLLTYYRDYMNAPADG